MKNELVTISRLNKKILGFTNVNTCSTEALLLKRGDKRIIEINAILNLDIDETEILMQHKQLKFYLRISIVARRNTVNTRKNWLNSYSEGWVHSISSDFKENNITFYRAFYTAPNKKILINLFGSLSELNLNLCGVSVKLTQQEEYLIFENTNPISIDQFSEICYSVLLATGFVSGKFVQDEVFLFQYENSYTKSFTGYQCRSLRPSTNSIYEAFTNNSYSYHFFTGEKVAQEMYSTIRQNYLTHEVFSNFVELIYNNGQIQYAMVLFNEAMNDKNSLLIKNSCLFTVFEVLKKYYYDLFHHKLENYSNKGNVKKYKAVFEIIAPLSNSDINLFELRNKYLHGDIQFTKGDEMFNTMLKQVSFLHKIVLSHIGFEGYILDQFALRNNEFPYLKICD